MADLYYWTLTPNVNVRQSMSTTLLEDASTNHQVRVFMVSTSDGTDRMTWIVENLEVPQRCSACPIVVGWESCALVCQSLCAQEVELGTRTMTASYIGGDFTSTELTVRFPV